MSFFKMQIKGVLDDLKCNDLSNYFSIITVKDDLLIYLEDYSEYNLTHLQKLIKDNNLFIKHQDKDANNNYYLSIMKK